ncbi:Actin cross-linking protein [Forsythia ovata]|uniref:Actin cross-linking protein n=1 Tax=Forsythia ovata TaxID=205694 RepID=A0ABD1SQP5_9LAMI
MEFFNEAKVVQFKNHLNKYLVADEDEETVRQSGNGGASKKARWTVELVEGNPHVIRLKGCHGKYLTAADVLFLLGITGKKVLQTVPATKKDISVEWEPIKERYKVKLRTK